MWFALVSTFAAVTIIFHWWSSRPIGRPRKPKRKACSEEPEKTSEEPILGGEKSSIQPLRLEAKRGRHICSNRALLIIAHPDDECMFFAPTILGLIRDGCDLHILCLSSGNYAHQGLKRKVELRHSCVLLGVTPANITVVEHTKLPDNPNVTWSKHVVKDIILKYVSRLDVDTVITFDGYGVTGHANHCALFTAVQHVYSRSLLPKGTQVYLLQSVNLMRKYSALADIWLSHLDGSTCMYVSGYLGLLKAQLAFIKYRSQLTWFRMCYIVLSRYMCINTYKRVVLEERYYQRNPGQYTRNNNRADSRLSREVPSSGRSSSEC